MNSINKNNRNIKKKIIKIMNILFSHQKKIRKIMNKLFSLQKKMMNKLFSHQKKIMKIKNQLLFWININYFLKINKKYKEVILNSFKKHIAFI